ALQVFLTAGFNQNNRAFLGAVVDSAICERNRAFGHAAFVRVPFVPQNLPRLEVETGQVAAAVAAVCAEQCAVVEDYAAVMIFHRLRKPDFLRSTLTGCVLSQPGQSAARPVSRSGEYMAVVIDRRGDIEPHPVGGLVISPE